ncbi:MAG: phytanoyl-CoA dioxygenase family protein [Chloroflexi bacterium]|nr:phytanoyl-CoA dioxygenase family protein [Chloroflexota bacterium]
MVDSPDKQHDVSRIVAEIQACGYCIVPSVIAPEKADEARAALERLLAEEITDERRAAKTQRVGGIAYKHPIFAELLELPLIVKIWQTFLDDDDIVCSTWSANTSYPGYNDYHWHADYPYWWINQPWPLDKVCGQTILMLDDFSEENGGTGFVPNSHMKGHMPPAEWKTQWPAEAQILTGLRGSALVFHGALWHSARPNRSDKARSALLGMYTRPFFLQMEDMLSQLARIENPSDMLRQLMGAKRYQPSIVGA